MKRKSVLYAGVAAFALLSAIGIGSRLETTVFAQGAGRGTTEGRGAAPATTPPSGTAAAPARGAAASSSTALPVYRVQPFWPQPLPDHWNLGAISGIAIDSKDHVWILHRGPNSLNAPERSMNLPTGPTSNVCCVTALYVHHDGEVIGASRVDQTGPD